MDNVHVHARENQFSFCVALYEALYQKRPFSGSTVSELAANTIAGHWRPPPPDSLVPVEIWSALQRGLAVAPDARFPSMAELLSELALDERSPARGRRTRWRISAAIIIGGGITAAAVHRTERALTPPDLVLLATIAPGILTAVTIGFRRALQRSTFSRELMVMALLSMLTGLFVRVLGWKLHLSTQQILPIDLMVLSGLLSLIAYQRVSALWWVVLGLFLASIAELQRPAEVERITKAVYAVLPLIAVLAWRRAARQPAVRPDS